MYAATDRNGESRPIVTMDNVLLGPDGTGGQRKRARLRRHRRTVAANRRGEPVAEVEVGTQLLPPGAKKPRSRNHASISPNAPSAWCSSSASLRPVTGRGLRDLLAAVGAPGNRGPNAGQDDRYHAAERIGSSHAARHDRPWPDGSQHRAPPDARRAYVCRLRRQPRRRGGARGEGATGATTLDDFVAKLDAPRCAWVMVPAGDITETTVREIGARLSAATPSSTAATRTTGTTFAALPSSPSAGFATSTAARAAVSSVSSAASA